SRPTMTWPRNDGEGRDGTTAFTATSWSTSYQPLPSVHLAPYFHYLPFRFVFGLASKIPRYRRQSDPATQTPDLPASRRVVRIPALILQRFLRPTVLLWRYAALVSD